MEAGKIKPPTSTLLGQGAFGRVYEAHDPQLDRPVAIKVSKEVLGPDAVNRFLREARSAAHLRHPNIIVPTRMHWLPYCCRSVNSAAARFRKPDEKTSWRNN